MAAQKRMGAIDPADEKKFEFVVTLIGGLIAGGILFAVLQRIDAASREAPAETRVGGPRAPTAAGHARADIRAAFEAESAANEGETAPPAIIPPAAARYAAEPLEPGIPFEQRYEALSRQTESLLKEAEDAQVNEAGPRALAVTPERARQMQKDGIAIF